MPKLKSLLAIVVALVVYAALDYSSARPATLLHVVDGDTIHILLDGNKHKVRLFGIDSPERRQAGGPAAGVALREMTDNGEITVKSKDQDRYGRMVATIYVNGQNINTAMVRAGHAWWYRDYAELNVPLAWAEFSARRENLGLWGADDPIPPWEWRRK